jgi:hypothetical protein
MTYGITTEGIAGLAQLEADLIDAAPRTVKKIPAVLKKSAQNIKNAMQADARKSQHFKQIARTVTYDVNTFGFDGDASIEAEIGYDKAAGSAAALAGIAIFGSSRPGGGTVRNPQAALADEAQGFERALEATLDGLL